MSEKKAIELARSTKLAELADAQEGLDAAIKFYEQKKADAKDAKDSVEACQDALNSVCKDLRDIERGEYQQPLPFTA